METSENCVYVIRTQKDISISLKFQVVKEIELGQLERTEARYKYVI